MDLLTLHDDLTAAGPDTVLVMAMDGWTDAGRGGTMAAEALLDQIEHRHVGGFDADRLFDYRDRRPSLDIDRGRLGDPDWPSLDLYQATPTDGPTMLVLTGEEPDFHWQGLCADIVELAEQTGATRYVGLGAVPGPIPHTRPAKLIATSSDPELLEAVGRPHERVLVPASCQVVIETALRDADVTTLGMWVRIPHYVAGDYPEAAQLLLQRVSQHLGLALDAATFDSDVEEHRQRLDVAARSSPEVQAHIEQLEEAYDSDVALDGGLSGPLPTGDQIAAELERFLREEGGGDG